MHALDCEKFQSIVTDWHVETPNDQWAYRTQAMLREAQPTKAVTADRERIARDLHDSVIQRLFGVGLSLQAALIAVDGISRKRVSDAVDTLDDAINELRETIFALTTGSDVSVVCVRFRDLMIEAESALGFAPQLQFDGAIETIHPAIALHLIAVAREALSNVAQHAHASRVRVVVAVDIDIDLIILDDGVGYQSSAPAGHGLLNMRTRAAHCGGTFELQNATLGGTHLEWRVPTR